METLNRVSHYHRINPAATGKYDKYLDVDRNPVPQGSQASWLLPPKEEDPSLKKQKPSSNQQTEEKEFHEQ